MNFKSISKGILNLDSRIISVEIANMDGGILAIQEKSEKQSKGPNVSREDAELIIMRSILSMNLRKTAESVYGRVRYSFTEYDKIKQAVIAWYSKFLIEEVIVLLSIEKEAEHQHIISKVLKHLDSSSFEIFEHRNH